MLSNQTITIGPASNDLAIARGSRMKDRLIGAGFGLFRATGLHKLATPVFGGVGAILMFHHVRPWSGAAFAPNRLLEITPEFLETTLDVLQAQDIDVVSMDEAVARLAQRRFARRFAVLTFDDGYRDNAEFAAPILRARAAPYTVFVTTGFAGHSASLWWLELEEAIRRLDHVEATIAGARFVAPARDDAEKSLAFSRIYPLLRAMPEDDMRAVIAGLLARSGGASDFAARLCMSWDEIAALAADPLCTIGAHTLTHPMLAKHPRETALRELAESKAILEARLGRKTPHLAYPVGDPTSAGVREFELAREAGFETAVTTRPGMIFPEHAAHLTALPRLSVNGRWQERGFMEALLSGAPFALWNRGRRLNVA